MFHEHTYGHEVVAFHELPADDDTIVLMSFGMHLPETPTNPAASSLHHAARQGDELPEDLTSDTESNSSEDLAWHETQVFTVSLPARIVQLNQINPNLRKQQIARACNWPLQQVYADYFVLHRPRDLEDRMLHVRLIQRQGELPTDSDLQLLLVDIEYHPVPPSWEIDRSRYPRYFPPSMTSRQLLEQLEIARYCDHVILPCLVWLDKQLRSLSDVALQQLQHGQYIRVAVPPSDGQAQATTRYVAMGMQLGMSQQECITDYSQLMAEDAIDSMFLLQVYHAHIHDDRSPPVAHIPSGNRHTHDADDLLLSNLHTPKACLLESSTLPLVFAVPTNAGPVQVRCTTPRIEATLGHHNASPAQQPTDHTHGMSTNAIPLFHAGPMHQRCMTPRIKATLGYHNALEHTDDALTLRATPDHFRHAFQLQCLFYGVSPMFNCFIRWPHANSLIAIHPKGDRCGSTFHLTKLHLPSNISFDMVVPTHRRFVKKAAIVVHFNCHRRIGEAKVPGPTVDPDAVWAIGAINPTGIAGKATLFADLCPGIYAISESHLTARGKVRFNQELWHAKSPFKFFGGFDAPYKTDGLKVIGGKHTGLLSHVGQSSVDGIKPSIRLPGSMQPLFKYIRLA